MTDDAMEGRRLAAELLGSSEDFGPLRSMDAAAGRALAFEIMTGDERDISAPPGGGRSPEEMLEAGEIDIESYRRRISSGAPAGAPRLTAAPSVMRS